MPSALASRSTAPASKGPSRRIPTSATASPLAPTSTSRTNGEIYVLVLEGWVPEKNQEHQSSRLYQLFHFQVLKVHYHLHKPNKQDGPSSNSPEKLQDGKSSTVYTHLQYLKLFLPCKSRMEQKS